MPLAASSVLFLAFLLVGVSGGGSRAPVPDDHQGNQTQGLHVIRVIDAVSKVPVAKAKVTVELENPAKTKWEGHTDGKGVFTFICELPNGSVKAHTSVDAPGFWSLVDYFPLIEERVLALNRTD